MIFIYEIIKRNCLFFICVKLFFLIWRMESRVSMDNRNYWKDKNGADKTVGPAIFAL